jgi:SAM-dependent methyltransferase/uncharacterized protein YbaR (Trm112 family)
MQTRLLDILRCPITHEHLILHVDQEIRVNRVPGRDTERQPGNPADSGTEIWSGTLTAATSGFVYRIVNGVPRMLVDPGLPDATSVNVAFAEPDTKLSNEYRQTIRHFRTQWDAFSEEEKTFGMTVDESWRYFCGTLRPRELQEDWFDGKLFLDAGCGHGKYVDALSARGAEVVAFDITPEIERVYRRIGHRSNVHLVQANILYPPFEQATFDFVMSNGVIHHTPDTREAFRAISRLPKAGGFLAIWVYPYRSRGFDAVSQALRAITSRLPSNLLRALCYLPVPLLSIPGWGAYSGTNLKTASWRQCAQVIYDFFGPKYQTHHTQAEVSAWYQEEGYETPWFGPNPLSASAKKAG